MIQSVTRSAEWRALQAHAEATRSLHLKGQFSTDVARFERFSCCELDLLFDYSRQRLTAETLPLLFRLANARGLKSRIDAMFAGEIVNPTEGRAALHTALRNRSDRPVLLEGKDVMADVRANLEKMRNFVDV